MIHPAVPVRPAIRFLVEVVNLAVVVPVRIFDMRRRGRTDANQTEIVKVFRKLGFSVAVTSMIGQGFPDIIIGKHKCNWLIEIKDGKKVLSQRDLTDDEEKFISNWKGSVFLVETIEQAIALAKLLDEGMIWGTKV